MSEPTADRELPSELNPRGRTRRKGPHRHRLARVLSWIAVVTSVSVLLASGIGYATFAYYVDEVKRTDAFGGIAEEGRPERMTDTGTNYLLVGVDDRESLTEEERRRFTTGGVDVADGKRTDTMILLHLSPDRDEALLVSLPRDSYVPIPGYVDGRGVAQPEQRGRINSAYNEGGVPLAIRTVEQLSRVRIDHYVEVNFAGFANMVDALGGVEVCAPRPLQDVKSGLDLPAGRSTVGGVQGLAYVRSRDTAGSDLGRIERQQSFLAAMMREATSSDTLLNPLKLKGFLDASVANLTFDQGMSRQDVQGLLLRLRGLDSRDITFTTLPIADSDYTTSGGARVALVDEPAAEALFADVRSDAVFEEPGDAADADRPPPPPPLTVSPSSVQVEVLNGSGRAGLGGQVSQELEGIGFELAGGPANADRSTYPTTLVRHGPQRADSARTVAAAIPGATTELVLDLGTTVQVVVGADFAGTRDVQVGDEPDAGESPKPKPRRSAAEDICS